MRNTLVRDDQHPDGTWHYWWPELGQGEHLGFEVRDTLKPYWVIYKVTKQFSKPQSACLSDGDKIHLPLVIK